MPAPATAATTWLLAATTDDRLIRNAIREWADTLAPDVHATVQFGLSANPQLDPDELTLLAGTRTSQTMVTRLLERADVTADHVATWWPTETRPGIVAAIIGRVPGIDAYAAERGAALAATVVDFAILSSLHTSHATKVSAATRWLTRATTTESVSKMPTVMRLAQADSALARHWSRLTDRAVWARATAVAPLPQTYADLPPRDRRREAEWARVVLGWLAHSPRDLVDLDALASADPVAARIIAENVADLPDSLATTIVSAHPQRLRTIAAVAAAPALSDTVRKQTYCALVAAAATKKGATMTKTPIDGVTLRRYGHTDPEFANAFIATACEAGVPVPEAARGWTLLNSATLERLVDAKLADNGNRWPHVAAYEQVIFNPAADAALTTRAYEQMREAERNVSTLYPSRPNGRFEVLDAAVRGALADVPLSTWELYVDVCVRHIGGQANPKAHHVGPVALEALGADLSTLRSPAAIGLLDSTAAPGVATLGELLTLVEALAI